MVAAGKLMMDLGRIKHCVGAGDYYWTGHADQERQADGLSVKQVEEAVLGGRILEKYPDTGRGIGCLIAGFCREGIPIHVVCGFRGGFPVIVTTYIPKPPRYKNPFERADS